MIPWPKRRAFHISSGVLALITAMLVLVAAVVAAQRLLAPSPWDKIHNANDPTSSRFSPDYKIIATDSIGEGVQLWDASSKRLIDNLGDSSLATQLSFTPDGRYFAWSNTDYVLFYDLFMQRMQSTPVKAKSWVYAMAFAPDSETLATGGTGVELWNRMMGDQAHYEVVEDVGDKAAVYALAFSADTKLLTAGLSNGAVHIWQLHRGNPPIHFKTAPLFSIDAGPVSEGGSLGLAFSPDSQTLAVGHDNGDVSLFSLQDGHLLKQMQIVGRAHKLSFSSDSKLLAVGGASYGDSRFDSSIEYEEITVWQVSDGAKLWGTNARSGYVTNLTFSLDNKSLTAGYYDGSIHNYNLP